MSAPLLEDARALPADELASLNAQMLHALQRAAFAALAAAKADADHLDRALQLKYADAAQALRLEQGRETGTVHLSEGAVRIAADLPKLVEWDQIKLGTLVERIRQAGDDPTEFVSIRYSVDERKYAAWPARWRAMFDPARTVKTGTPAFQLEPMEGRP